MSKKDDGFGEFMAFNFLTKGGGCIMSILPIISIVGVTVLLFVIL